MCCFYNSIFSTFIIIFYLFIYGLKCIQHVFIYSVFTECKALCWQFSHLDLIKKKVLDLYSKLYFSPSITWLFHLAPVVALFSFWLWVSVKVDRFKSCHIDSSIGIKLSSQKHSLWVLDKTYIFKIIFKTTS